MSNNFGCKLALKADEHDVLGCENYPFVVPKVFLEGCEDPVPYVEGTESVVVIRGNKMVTYTRGSITEVLKRDAAGNSMWVESRNLANYDDDYWYDESWDDLREVDVHKVTVCNLGNLEKSTYKVVFDGWCKMDSEDLLRAEKFFDGKILDDRFVVKDGVLKHCLRVSRDLVIPETVVEIEKEAFSGVWYLESISLPASLVNIPETLIDECKVRHVTVAEGNPRYYTENGCLIDRYTETLLLAYAGITIPEDGSVKKIGRIAFRGCGQLNSIVIPDWVTEIEDGAFSDCLWLEEVRMPDCFSDRIEDIFGKKFVKDGDVWKAVERNVGGFRF